MIHKTIAFILVVLGLTIAYFSWLGAAMSSGGGSVWEIAGIPLGFGLALVAAGIAYFVWILRRR
jgi:hypothetical protein